ncbi:MAG: gamma-glutamylcyclotransferase [Gammaproteobacteria bacterium]|nr:MAG: gamma-glutamylcyclotransferase [Gammaproteobacteria bacterium]
MLRVILWKIGCELAHLKRALWPRHERKIHYFAFGANLCSKVLEKRCIKVFDAFDYVLDDASLCFSLPGFYRGHGYASADAAEGEVVYGRMYLILERDAVRMDYFEGVPCFGVHEKVFRQDGDFRFFFYRATRTVGGLRPTREYLDYLIDAYRQMPAVPADYLAAMQATEVLETFEPLDETGTFVSDLDSWPRLLHPLLLRYERLCSKLVELVWHRSPLQWLIRI